MKAYMSLGSLLVLLVFLSPIKSRGEYSAQDSLIRGRYLVQVSGCNDCHTAGYAPSNGTLSEESWLLGDSIGWHGPWGTTYPVNLRLYASRLTEDQWVSTLKGLKSRPPMPYWALNQMDERDLRDMYIYIRSLPVIGKEAPSYLPPGQQPQPPYFTMVVPE